MSTQAELDFWINEADPDVDICDKRFSDEDFLRLIFPEIAGKPKSIVEIGCGIGRLTNKVKEQYPGTDVTGIDINPRFLKIARQRGSANYVLASDLDSCKNVDFIYSVLLFQHLDNQTKAEYIRQAGRALSKGGAFLFQYVEGDHASRAMYDAKIEDVRQWCEDSGLKITLERKNQVGERWTWIKAIKK